MNLLLIVIILNVLIGLKSEISYLEFVTMSILLNRLNNCGLRYFKFIAPYSTQTHFGFQTVDEAEKSKKGIKNLL